VIGFPSLTGDMVSVVVRGNFNPAIFSPAWLLHQGLVGSAEFEASTVQVISGHVASFETGWLQVVVTADSLQLLTNDADEFERVRDAVVGVLRALEHTPISQLGLNRQVRFVMGSAEEWHTVGDRIMPKDIWKGVLEYPGLQDATIWGIRPDDHAGRVQVQVQPVVGVQLGVQVAYNDHYDLTTVEKRPGNRESVQYDVSAGTLEFTAKKIPIAVGVLTENWTDFMRRTDIVIRRIYTLPEA
jgi:hypothetical protein